MGIDIRDDIARLKPGKAASLLSDYKAQLEYQNQHLSRLKDRRAKLLKKLDAEIVSVKDDIRMTETVIDEIAKAHFSDSVYDECF